MSGQGVGFGFQTRRTDIAAQTGVSVQRVRGVSGVRRARGRGSPVQPHGVKRLEAPTEPAGETSPLDGAQRRKNGELLHLAIRRPVPPRRAHEYMAVRLCIEVRL